ncbi:MAG: SLC13 family permease [Fusobacterium sp. JB021]|nr:SLC13 family permease [Fusobacterium sp. JB020]MDP0493096.1 SLC13 family permease [Fusobacterium sp. JB021]MDP0507528.1 SLC13 family permease [Fusobacterium sp. JB019]
MLFNPVIISVTIMMILCILRTNVIIAILISALTAGLSSGMGLSETMSILIKGMGGNSETALSYILLGTLAVAINNSGLANIISLKIFKIVKNKKYILIFIIASLACLSQNLIPVHIAFIPILIPPLLTLMNKLKIDRRAVACALTFGLKAPYIALPVGFGLIFQTIIRDQLIANGVSITLKNISAVNWTLGLGMFFGLLFALFISYKNPREYKDFTTSNQNEDSQFTKKHALATLSTLLAFGIQLKTGSLPLGALFALIFMSITKVIPRNLFDDTLNEGVNLMGFIAFVMLVAAGFGNVIRETGAVPTLVQSIIHIIGNNKILGASLMLLIGLFITLGIGTSFGTIPILAVIYCPLALKLGFSPQGIAILISAAGALGDAGSPASDSTLGPTSGLNSDNQHNHIWDTCIPTFLHFNIPLIIFGILGAFIF